MKGRTDRTFVAGMGRMPANIDRVGRSSKFLQKTGVIKDSVSPPQTALVLASKGKGKSLVHPTTGHKDPEWD